MDEKQLRRKDVLKVVRTVFEILVILAVVLWAAVSLVSHRSRQRIINADAELDCTMIPCDEVVGAEPRVRRRL